MESICESCSDLGPLPSKGYRGAIIVSDKDSTLDMRDSLYQTSQDFTVFFVEPGAKWAAFAEDHECHLRTQGRALKTG